MTDCALEDVPARTKCILGDPELNSENCVSKLRNLPKISSDARDFFAGGYINIEDRLWNTTNDSGKISPGQIETRLYHGATADQIVGARIRVHLSNLKKPVSQVEAEHTKQGRNIPYHYQFGCQADPSEDGTRRYECRSDFRSLGHISDKDMSNSAWPWLRELVNQILLNMLPGLASSFRCKTLTTETLKLVHDIRQKIESEFGQLPDLSSLALNRGCCMMEPPRISGAIRATRKACVKCQKPYVTRQTHHKKGIPWQDVFSLFQRGNPFGGVICAGCKYSNPPPGHKMCRGCTLYKPLSMFRDNRKRCRACSERARELRQEKRKAAGLNCVKRFSEEDDKILKECISKKLKLDKIAEASRVSQVVK